MSAAAVIPMAPPLYPEREVYTIGEHPEAIKTLREWVDGSFRHFHPYGSPPTYDRQFRQDYPARLELRGSLADGYIRWSLFYWRAGDSEGHGGGSGHSDPSDACYAALSLIEQHEREEWEQALVIGLG